MIEGITIKKKIYIGNNLPELKVKRFATKKTVNMVFQE